MAKFAYKAKDWDGKMIKGVLELATKEQVIESIKDSGLIPMSVTEVTTTIVDEILKTFMSRMNSKQIANFTRQLSTMLKAGLPLTDALSLLKNQSDEKSGIFEVSNHSLDMVRAGQSLGKSLSKYRNVFGEAYIATIIAGEEGGVLEDVLLKLADNLEKEEEFKSKVKGAMVYPIIVICGMIIVIFLMMILVIPKLTGLYSDFGSEVPAMTKGLMAISGVMTRFWFLFPVLIVIGFIGFRFGSQNPSFREKIDNIKFKIPIWGALSKKTIIANTIRTLAMLLGAGITLVDALKIVANVADSQIYTNAYLDIAQKVQKGFSVAESFENTGIFPGIINQMVATGEATGKLDEVLKRVAEYFAAESEQSVKSLTTAIEPIIMIILGIGVAFLVIAVIMPIYNLTSSFG